MADTREELRRGRRRIAAGAAIAVLPLALTIAGCGTGSGDTATGASGDGAKLEVVGYSTPETVYEDSLEPGFQKTPQGAGVTFSNSFGASGDQSRAVEAGQPAAIVHFAQGADMTRLVEAGLVSPAWTKQKYHGIAANSIAVLVVRKGNPKGIRSFDDLVEDDVSVITPNPFSSGSARWNIMAIYGSQLHEGKSPSQALDGVRQVLAKTKVQPGSARDALAAFSQSDADVLIAYENEAIRAQEEGEDVDYVVPPSTILIETPIAVTRNAPEPAARNYLAYNWSDAGQQVWARNGYRPVNPKLVDPRQFPTPKDLFTIAEFGGWDRVGDEFFDETSGKVAEIEKSLGVSTG